MNAFDEYGYNYSRIKSGDNVNLWQVVNGYGDSVHFEVVIGNLPIDEEWGTTRRDCYSFLDYSNAIRKFIELREKQKKEAEETKY